MLDCIPLWLGYYRPVIGNDTSPIISDDLDCPSKSVIACLLKYDTVCSSLRDVLLTLVILTMYKLLSLSGYIVRSETVELSFFH